MRSDITLLRNLGFSTNEARVYIAALEAGSASAQTIATLAGLQRTTTYSVLNILVRKGMVGKSKERGKFRYVAEPPERLVTIVQGVAEDVRRHLPEFSTLYNKNPKKPKIVFYEGNQAIRNVCDDTLRERPDEILQWDSESFLVWQSKQKKYPYIALRAKYHIKAKRIAPASNQFRKHSAYDKGECAETILVPPTLFNPGVEVNIYNNKVAFLNYAEDMGVIIESVSIAEVMREAYRLSWLGAKQVAVNREEVVTA